ncbi:MAG: preprotein translocase subunit YajC [Oscillospiraceae bacterium]|nr:preprotein translocase subunit YajC [Oscillospiraceae bacterium]
MLNMLLAAAPAEEVGAMGLFGSFMWFVPIIAIMYFLMIRPQKKREKAVQEMRSKIEVGDEVITVGGIIGRVASIKDDSLVLETGSDRSKIRIMRWAVQSNNTVHDTPDSGK